MDYGLFKALLYIAMYCQDTGNCETCALKELCGKPVNDWTY